MTLTPSKFSVYENEPVKRKALPFCFETVQNVQFEQRLLFYHFSHLQDWNHTGFRAMSILI